MLQACGVPTTRSDGGAPPKQLFGGHCLKVSGAQFLAAAWGPDLHGSSCLVNGHQVQLKNIYKLPHLLWSQSFLKEF